MAVKKSVKKLAKTVKKASTKKAVKKTATKKAVKKNVTKKPTAKKTTSKKTVKKVAPVKATNKANAKKGIALKNSIKSSGDIVLLLSQHVGKPCVPCVKKGDKVVVGQLVAKPQGLGANIHSSVSGIVTKVDSKAISIKPSTILSIIGQVLPKKLTTSKDDYLGRVTESGCVGMGGAGFPTGVKLSTNLNGGYILVNAAECEPLLAHNMAQIMKYPKETIEGIHYCMEIANAKHGIIAIKQKHKKEVECLLKYLKGIDDIHVHLLPDIYPMGEERAVVRECLGKLLPVTDLPAAAGAHVCNIETILRVYEAIKFGRPVVSKNVTIAGKMKWGKTPKVMFDVPIGMKVRDLLAWAGGIDGKYGEIIMGGPFTGKPCSLDDPITKTTGGLIVTEPFKDYHGEKVGILVCACGGNEERLRDIAKKYNMKVVGDVQFCKQALDPKGNGMLKCENPGNCPGQAIKCMNIKNAGAKHILISNCSDCTNTVMGSAPGLGLEVHHETDHVFETVGMEVMRHLTKSKYIDGPIPKGCTASRNPEEKEKAKKSVKAVVNEIANDGFMKPILPIAPIAPVECKDGKPYGLFFNIQSGVDVSVFYNNKRII